MDSARESETSSSGEEPALSRRHQKREQMKLLQETAKGRKKKTPSKFDKDTCDPLAGTAASSAGVTEQPGACPTKEDGGERPWEHDKQPDIVEAARVIYCGVCGTPPDFCEFGDRWPECKKWIEKNNPELLPFACPPSSVSLGRESGATSETDKELAEGMLKLDVQTSQGNEGEAPGEAKKPGGGGKKKVEKPAKVTIQRQSRAKRKTATVITGLDLFGVKLDKAAKLFSKQYACGASVAKNVAGQPPQIEVQGDVEEEIAELIVSTFAVPRECIHLLAAK